MRQSRSLLTRLSVTVAVLATACSSAGPALVAADPTPAATSTAASVPTPSVGADAAATATRPPTEFASATRVATPTPEQTATAEQTATPTPQPDPTSPPQHDACVSGLIGNPTSISEAVADLDGDGASDQVTVYATGNSTDPWRVRVDTAAGESLDSGLGTAVLASTNAGPIGGADVDGSDGTDELFIIIGSGASTALVGIYSRVGCEVVQVTLNGSPATFPVGGSIGNIGGLQCVDINGDGVDDTVIAWSGSADFDAGEGQYVVEGVEYQLQGLELQEVGTRALTANTSQADFVYAELSCGSLSF